MKLTTLLRNLCFVAIGLLVLSFKPSDYNLLLKNGTFSLPEGQFAQSLKKPSVNGYHYRIIQFYSLPSDAQKTAMERKGILFFDYLPKMAYLVAIPEKLKLREISEYNIRSIAELNQSMKLSPEVAKATFSDWALHGSTVKLIVAFYPNLSKATIERSLQKLDVTYAHRPSTGFVRISIATSRISELANHPLIYYVQEDEDPGQPENNRARNAHRVTAVQGNFPGGLNYDGSGVLVAVGDDGSIGPHIDYQGRLTDYAGASQGNHGDHVAGTVFGAGNLNPNGRGMAPGANIAYWDYFANGNFYLDGVDTQYTNMGVRITQSSYSNGTNTGYTALCRQMDEDCIQNPKLIHVFSAGNAGSGWYTITGGHKQGKNVIATANITWNEVIASSSSRGPAHDGRLKPEVSAVGTDVFSTVQPQGYANYTGTSMASPGVAGSMALLYQAYRQNNNSQDPDGGLMKAMLMNTADDLGNAGPDFWYGYGRINVLRAIEDIEDNHILTDQVSQGQADTLVLNVPANLAELRVMVYWIDPQASVLAQRALVNNLNFTLKRGTNTWQPWVLNSSSTAVLNQPAVRATDSLNNAEQVTLANPTAGDYQVIVNGTTVPNGPQKYFVVYSFVENNIRVTHPIGGETFVPNVAEVIRWDAPAGTSTFNVEYSLNNGTTFTTINANVPATQRYLNWTPPAGVSGQALIRVTRGAQSGTSQAPFSIIGVPSNLQIAWACPDSMLVTWNAVAGATGYEVSMLGQKYMDSIGTTTNTQFKVTGINPTKTYWLSVRALGPNGANGRRAVAIQKAPGTSGCPIATDAVLQRIISPTLHPLCQGTNAMQVSVRLANSGSQNITAVPIAFRVNNGAILRDTIIATLTPGALPQVFTLSPSFSVASPGVHNIKVYTELANDQNKYNDTISSTFRIYASTSQALPYTENFDNFSTCATTSNCALSCNLSNGWTNAINLQEDDSDWRTHQGATPSSGTGPTSGRGGSGRYLYIEASGGCTTNVAQLITPCFNLANIAVPEASIYYYMLGTSMGQLHVDVLADGLWYLNVVNPISGNQGSNWIKLTIPLTQFAGKMVNIRFRGIIGTDFSSDIALDDFNIQNSASPPAPEFVANDVAPCLNSTVTFTDQSSGAPTAWQWTFTPASVTFVNGTTALSQNPQVQFNTLASYTIKLKCTNVFGTDSIIKTSYVTPVNGTPLAVTEDFQGTFPPSGWAIRNPDANTTWIQSGQVMGATGIATLAATINNFSYNAPFAEDAIETPKINTTGTSSVLITFDVAHARYSATYEDGLRVDVSTDCGATFQPTGYLKTGSTLATVPDQTSLFSPSNATNWRKDTVQLSNLSASTIVLRFVGINGFGNAVYIDNINIYNSSVAAPIASFNASTLTPCVGSPVVFTNTSTGPASSYTWNFGANATPSTASTAGPHTVTYSAGGTKTPQLIVGNAGGQSTAQQTLTVIELPNASFTASYQDTLTWVFTNQSTPTSASWLWQFGDGNTSTAQNPTHTYANGGNYNVTLTTTNSCGNSDTTFSIYVSGIGIDASQLEYGVQILPNPASHMVQLQANFNTKRDLHVELRDIAGKLIATTLWHDATSGSMFTLDVSQMPAGVYMVHLHDMHGRATKRLIISR